VARLELAAPEEIAALMDTAKYEVYLKECEDH
jgi:hypothetical protein